MLCVCHHSSLYHYELTVRFRKPTDSFPWVVPLEHFSCMLCIAMMTCNMYPDNWPTTWYIPRSKLMEEVCKEVYIHIMQRFSHKLFREFIQGIHAWIEVSIVSQSVIVYSNADHSTCNGNGQRKGKVKFLLLFCEVLPLCFFFSLQFYFYLYFLLGYNSSWLQ